MSIIKKDIGDWIYIINTNAVNNAINCKIQMHKILHGSNGKYLFFSDNKEQLIELAKEILIKYELYSAKVPKTDIPKKSIGFGFVLCVYDEFERYTDSLQQYETRENINYRRWKSDSDTIKGKYSKYYKETER